VSSAMTEMVAMFWGCTQFNASLFSVDSGNVVTNLMYMFKNASSFNQNLDHWHIGSSVNTNNIFSGSGGSATWA